MSPAADRQFPAAFQPAINEIALVAKLRTAKWSGQIVDKKVSSYVHAEMFAAEDAGKYVKTLVPAKEFQEINKHYRALCTFHRRNTLVWGSHGEGLLPTSNFETYQTKVNKISIEFRDSVNALMARLPEIKREAEKRLGSMWNSDEFPSDDEIYAKFNLSVDFSPLPSQEDFRLNLKTADLERLRNKYRQTLDTKLQDSMLNLWGRLYGVVDRIARTLANPEKRFQKTMLDNAAELIELLPRLNIIQRDANLERVCQEVSNQLLAFTAEELRSNLSDRMNTANAAKSIASRIEEMKPGLRAIEF